MQLTHNAIVDGSNMAELEQKMLKMLVPQVVNSIRGLGLYAKGWGPSKGRSLGLTLEYVLGVGNYANMVAPTAMVFSRELNEGNWTSPSARADGLVRLGVAQLFSRPVDPKAWLQKVAIGLVREILPMGLRAVSRVLTPDCAAELPELIGLCEGMNPTASGMEFSAVMDRVCEDSENVSKKATPFPCSPVKGWREGPMGMAKAANAVRFVFHGIEDTVLDADECARLCALAATTTAVAVVSNAASSRAWSESQYCSAESDMILSRAAEIGAVALQELGSPGGQWLHTVTT